jgi:hypothetical protein
MTEFAPTDLWPVTWVCDVSTESATATGRAVRFASDTLWALTGRQFGLTETTLRPCRNIARETPFPDAWLSWPGTQRPPLGASASGGIWGYWVPALCGSCSSGCSCTSLSEVKLPVPVNSIVQVKIDGVALPSTSYRVDDNRFLIRTDGQQWPSSNDLGLDDDQIGTWAVTAQYGVPVPDGAGMAVGELACQFLKGMHGEDCRLPRTVTQLARQGVSITMPNPDEVFKRGMTGLYFVDLFIRTWNPNRLRQRSRVYSVDSRMHRRADTGV